MSFARTDVQAMWEGFRDEAHDALGIPRLWSGDPCDLPRDVHERKMASARELADEMMRQAVERGRVTPDEWRVYRSNMPDGQSAHVSLKFLGAGRPEDKRPAPGQKPRSATRSA